MIFATPVLEAILGIFSMIYVNLIKMYDDANFQKSLMSKCLYTCQAFTVEERSNRLLFSFQELRRLYPVVWSETLSIALFSSMPPLQVYQHSTPYYRKEY